MHKEWEELIPYYVAGSLPRPETTRLESHLARCPECRRSLDEWRAVASAVRAEAAAHLRDLPPLSARVMQIATQQAGDRRAPFQRQPLPRRAGQPSRYRAASVTLIAAVFTVIIFGGLLAIMLRGVLPQPAAESVALMPSATPFPATVTQAAPTESEPPSPVPQIIVIEPSATPFMIPSTAAPTQEPPTQEPLIFSTPMPTRVSPTRALSTAAPPLTATDDTSAQTFSAQAAAVKQGCVLRAASAGSVNLYAGPGTQYAVVNAFTQTDDLTALAVSGSGWYRAQYSFDINVWTGWVRADQVYASGACDSLPVVDGAQAATELPPTLITPTAYPDMPAVIVSMESINLRGGPGTNYPVIGIAVSGDRFPVRALASAADGVWYLVQKSGAPAVWVSSSVVQLVPDNALISPALTVPAPPAPSATVLPFMPTLTPSPTPSETTAGSLQKPAQ